MKNLDEVREKFISEQVSSFIKMCEEVGYPKSDEPLGILTEDIMDNTWTECAKLKDEEWRKVVEPLIKALDQCIRQWEMYVTDAARDDLENIKHQEAYELLKCKKALAEYEEKIKDEK